jgi:MSHA biogenesis protein MshP
VTRRARRVAHRAHARQTGVSLVAALFVIVVLAMLSLFAMRVGASGDQDVAATLLQDRALAAARSGIEYGTYRALVGGNCPTGSVTSFPALNLTQGALNGFAVSVSCQGFQHMHTPSPSGFYLTYEITATARRGVYGTPDYAARSLTKTVASGPPP